MPWELGLGDGSLKYENVALLPVSDTTNYGEQEYAALYGKIDKENSYFSGSLSNYSVIYPNGNKIELIDWLKK
jgi:hypothetical protein